MKKIISFVSIMLLLVTLSLSFPTASAKTNFKITATSTTTGVRLNWSKAKGAKYYKIYRKISNTKYKLVCKKTTKRKFTNKKLKSNKKYTYKVKAFKKNKKGKYYSFKSAVKSVKTKKKVKPITTTKPTTAKPITKPTTTINPPTKPTTVVLPQLSEKSSSLKSYFDSLTDSQISALVYKDFDYFIPNNSKLLNLEYSLFWADEPLDNLKETWGYSAKFELTKEGYNYLSKVFREKNNSSSETAKGYCSIYPWWDVSDSIVTNSNMTTGKGQLLLPNDYMVTIKTIWNHSWITSCGGEYYLYLDTPLSDVSCEWYGMKNQNV